MELRGPFPRAGDRVRWQELLKADRLEEAMALALQRLRIE